MEWRDRGIHQQASSSSHVLQSSNYRFFAEQAPRPAYMGPGSERDKPEHAQYHHQQQQQQQQHLYVRPHPCSNDLHKAIQREIEKECIRAEITMSEIMRRRSLEDEVRRELMMDWGLALLRGSNGFPFGSSTVTTDSPQTLRLPIMETRNEGKSLEEIIVLSLGKERSNGRCESGGFEALPYQRGPSNLRISEANPDQNISGSKRKAATPPSGAVAIEFSSDGVLRKKAKEEWSCALCRVSATSELALNKHLGGKKHKSKEAALRAHNAAKNYSIGLLPKKETREASSTRDDLLLLQKNLNSNNLKKNQRVIVKKVKRKTNQKKKKYKFWCEMCLVGVSSRKAMNDHSNGKKHIRRLQENERNGEVGPSHQKAVILLNHEQVAEVEKNMASRNVDETIDEAGSEDHKRRGKIMQEDHEHVDYETEAEDGRAMDITKPDDDHEPVDHETKAEDGGAVDITKDDEQTVLETQPRGTT
ncbi:uncharacterized protein LOC105166331 isoform X2 [Sesamum indicum]|uniref:Uncharacterized protein LOC105166331 isoform X2 n=1 Tax=Sesamum indicum TaxID=4182 RepID=A0A6I9TRS0_SESIN|nr:uncharacterized protein LOC105166331 isoform X2 [Sesamum indicum]